MLSTSIVIGLLQNTAILLAFGLLYDYFWVPDTKKVPAHVNVINGLLIGGFTVVLILTPWTIVPGLVFDTRSVLLSVAGLFFGPIPTVIAIITAGAYRIFLGGPGMMMGVSVILTSGAIGILWPKLRPGWRQNRSWLELLVLGICVHAVMLTCTLFLPGNMVLSTLKAICFPVMIIYPLATMLLGSLMIRRLKSQETTRALAESEERWKFALEGAEDGVWDWNPRNGDIFYTSRWKSMLGYQDDEIPMDTLVWHDLLHPDDRHEALQEIERHLKGETQVYQHIHRLRCKDGSYKWILDRGKVTTRDEFGDPVRFIGTHTDITERIRKEEELSSAKLKAEESDRLKLSFLNNISHEIRTPLNAIMGFSELLNDEDDPEKKAKYIRIILSNSDQLLGIITDVLEFSRLESEQTLLDLVPFSLDELLDELLDTLKSVVETKGNRLALHKPDPSVNRNVIGDKNKIRQVMINLISNANKYTPGGSIEFGWEKEDDHFRLFVRDNGIGIDPEHREIIFQRFYRTPAAQKMAVRGAGLGLSIARHLIDLMGGTIGVLPVAPHGSEFFILLKLIPYASENGTSGMNEKAGLPGSLSILIAEDEDANYELLEILLKNHSRKITRAVNGEEVLLALEESLPDLVLMDIKMPVMDGLEATRRIRVKYQNLPVVALSAYSQPEERRLAADAGCDHFLSKPVKKGELFEVISIVTR